MDHAISIDGSETRATPNERLEALKGRNLPTLDNQQPFGDGDMSKIMDLDLYEATEGGHVEMFIDALERVSESRKLALSLSFDQVTPSGNSLLHVAASSGKEDVMELILVHFPYLVTRKNSLDDTPLHVAVRNRRLEGTRKLIRLKRDSEIMYWKNKDSKSPLYLAAQTGDMEILRLLLEASARDEAYTAKIQGMSPVFAAIEEGTLDTLREIIDRLPKLLHVRSEDGGTPLHSAASAGNAWAVVFLLRKCPDLALQTDKNGSYPIHIACQGCNDHIIRKLVKMWPHLADITNKKGQNILHVAANAGNHDMVKSLLEAYGNPVIIEELVNSKDVDGNTPHDLASMQLRSTREPNFGANESSHLELIKKEIDARLVVATLVASVTFTAGITLPSGYNASSDPNPGMPIMLHNRGFQVFIIFDAFATYCSILSVLLLLRARSSNPLTRKLYFILAEWLLSSAVILMTVAFSASSIVAVSELKWLKIFFLCFGVYYAFAIYIFAGGLSLEVFGRHSE